jgi:hypothetical protein
MLHVPNLALLCAFALVAVTVAVTLALAARDS